MYEFTRGCLLPLGWRIEAFFHFCAFTQIKKTPTTFYRAWDLLYFRDPIFSASVIVFMWFAQRLLHLRARQVPPELSPPRRQTATRAVPHLMLCFLPFLFLGQPDVIQLCERDDSSQLWLISEIWILILICIFMHKRSESTGFFFFRLPDSRKQENAICAKQMLLVWSVKTQYLSVWMEVGQGGSFFPDQVDAKPNNLWPDWKKDNVIVAVYYRTHTHANNFPHPSQIWAQDCPAKLHQ